MEIKYISERDYEIWDEFCENNKYSTFFHTSRAMKYLIDSSFNIKSQQKSFFVYSGSVLVGCMPLFIEKIHNENYLSYGGTPLLNPLISYDLSEKSRKKVMDLILETLDEIAVNNNVKKIDITIGHLNCNYLEKTNKYNYLIKYGYLDKSSAACILNLSSSDKDILSNFTKGHKSAVKKSEKFLQLAIKNHENVKKDDVYDFMNYYFKIAGKKTRPQNTFDNIYEWIKEDFAILFIAKYENKICGYSLLYKYKNTAYYAMACKDKDYEQYNVSHFLQWEAIKYLKNEKIKYYELGTQDFNDSLYKFPSEKDLSISKFKRGFGGVIIPVFTGEKYYDKNAFKEDYQQRIENYGDRNFQ